MKGSSMLVLFLLLVLIVAALALSGAVDFDAMMHVPRTECAGQCGPDWGIRY